MLSRSQEFFGTASNRKIRNAILLVFVALFVGYLSIQEDQPAQPLASDEIIRTGEQIYLSTCAECHGEQGSGHAEVVEAPALNGSEHSWHHPDGQIQSIIVNGGILMPAFGEELTNNEIYSVIRYIQTWWSDSQLNSQQNVSQSNPFIFE